jgi:hypothetical protein
MAKHRIREHHWNNGMLSVLDHWFENLEEGMAFAENSEAHSIKVYTEDGQIVDKINPTPATTYA